MTKRIQVSETKQIKTRLRKEGEERRRQRVQAGIRKCGTSIDCSVQGLSCEKCVVDQEPIGKQRQRVRHIQSLHTRKTDYSKL